MAANVNLAIIAGNLTRDPVEREVGQSRVACFSIATNRSYRNRDGEKAEETTFVDIECWGRTAELVMQYLHKGRSALVEGRLKLDVWETEDGSKRSRLKIVASNVQFLGSTGEHESAPKSQGNSTETTAPAADDQPPF